MIHYGVYERMCVNGIPEEAVTRVDEKGDTWVLYIPTEKGKLYHEAYERYLLGEGGRGSAKSTTLRWDAHLRNMSQPGHRALLLRRTFPQLIGSHFSQVMREGKLLGVEMCPKPFNQTKYFLDYANGSLLKFGHCESDSAIEDYLSQEWDWIGFDELTTFTFNQFIRIAMSARSVVGSGKMSLIRGATNPIGEGASWVKRYFIDRSITEQENPDYRKEDWRSIKMNVEDNPHMDAKDYRQQLAMLPNESLRRAYMDGEWLVEGQFFHQFREKAADGSGDWHVLSEMPTLKGTPLHQVPWIQITRLVDWGYSEIEPGYCGWILNAPDGTAILFKELVFTKHTPEEAAREIAEMSKGMKIRMTIGDPMMWEERVGVSIAHRMALNGVSMIDGNNKRETGWMSVHTWLSTVYNDGVQARPRLQFLAPQEPGTGLGVPYAIRTLPALQTDPKHPKDIIQTTGVEDHAADAIRYWAAHWPAPSLEPQKNLDWVAPEIRRAMAAMGSNDFVLGTESVRRGVTNGE